MHRSRMVDFIGMAGLAVGWLLAGAAHAQTHTYTYDELGRLIATEIQSGASIKHRVYAYDPAGNRLEASGANGPADSPAPNSPPTANDDFYLIFMPVNHGILAPAVIDNDTDPDNDTLDVISHTDPIWDFYQQPAGVLYHLGGGQFIYDCPSFWFECDPTIFWGSYITFEYTVSDGNGGTDTAIVKIYHQ